MGGQQVGGAWFAELETRARAQVDHFVPTTNEADRLLHELQVHRIELEMQNEEMTRSHAALEKACERYQAVLAAAPMGYLSLDATGRIHDVNPLGARLVGLQGAELIDRHLQAFLPVADADRFHLRLKECLSTAHPQTLSVAMAQKDRPVRLQIVPNEQDDGSGPCAWVFMLELSLGDGLLPMAKARTRDVSSERATSARVVLLVDDDTTVLRAISRILKLEGYTVVAVSSGAEALEVARREDQNLDILLTDVRMPGMNGGELGRLMASIRPALPRVYMSGDIGDVVLEPGATLVAKPFRPDTLVRLIEQRLSSR